MERASKPKQIRLSTKPTRDDLAALKIGDIVYLDGLIYTGREGVYMRVLEGKEPLPLSFRAWFFPARHFLHNSS